MTATQPTRLDRFGGAGLRGAGFRTAGRDAQEKFSAKQAIDSFFVRAGDVLSAGLVFVGTIMFGLHSRGFAAINLGLVVVLLGLAWHVGRAYQLRTAPSPDAVPLPASPAKVLA